MAAEVFLGRVCMGTQHELGYADLRDRDNFVYLVCDFYWIPCWDDG
jgi:hypothetical protein